MEADNQIIKHTPTTIFRADFQIYCYKGRPKHILQLFQTINLQIDVEDDDFTPYESGTPEEVSIEYENQRSFFSFNIFSNKKKIIYLDPFNQTCVGIESSKETKVQLNLIRIDFWKAILLGLGIFVFFSSKTLAGNPVFYYLIGIFLGIFASFLVVVYLASKLFPRRNMMIGMIVGGWTLGIYLAQMIWENIQLILSTYQVYAFWYVIIVGFVSFLVCYKFGPPKTEKSKNLIQWGLQFIALIMIFCSSNFQEATIGINILSLIVYYFPKEILITGRSFWLRRFPPKPKLLTSEEFYEQGVRETIKALDELKTYCSSPECKQWKTMLTLKNPQRFANFMNGSSHIDDSEILDYETSQAHITDDSNPEMSEEEEEEVRYNNGFAKRNKSLMNSTRNGSTSGVRRNVLYRSYNGVEISDDE